MTPPTELYTGPQFEVRIAKLLVVPLGEPIFSERVTSVEIDDDAAGEFVRVGQESLEGSQGAFLIDPEEWPAIRATIDFMARRCRSQT